jgi:glycosyltransferase involved in cell wall biosynthesis
VDANPPRADGLATAIAKALGNGKHYARLREGALEVAAEFSVERHVEALNEVLEGAAARA